MTSGRWLWVARPEHYRDDHGNDHPDLHPARPRVPGTWCCSPATRDGDLGLLYRSRERKDISHLVVVRTDAERPETGSAPVCRVQVLARFHEPLPLAEMRADPVLRRWSALRASFIRRWFPVPDEVWARLLELLSVDDDQLARMIAAGERRLHR